MRLVSYDISLQTKKQIDRKVAMNFSLILGVAGFLFGLGVGFGAAIGFGLVAFLILFAFIYGIRSMITKSVYGRLRTVEVDGTYLDVMFNNEVGILVFTPTKLIYHPMQRTAIEKKIEFDISEDLLIGYGELNQSILEKLKFSNVPQGHVTVREMPHGMLRQFVYYNVDNAVEKVGQIVAEVSRFREDKYQ